MIQFDSSKHKYVRKGNEYISVTTLLSKYQKPFNKEYWLLYKAIQSYLNIEDKKQYLKLLFNTIPGFEFENNTHLLEFIKIKNIAPKDLQVSKLDKSWIDKNKKACDLGTQIHETLEQKDVNNQQGKISDKTGVLIINPNYQELDYGYYSELRLYLDEYGLAGTADKVLIFQEDNKKKFLIADYKTNEKLTFENKYQKLLFPLLHLEDTKFNIYSLQMSIYSYMLERQFGLEYAGSELIHFSDYNIEKETIYKTPYLKSEVITLLNHYKNATS